MADQMSTVGQGAAFLAGDTWSVTTYSSYAEINLLKPQEAANNPDAIEAGSLLQRLLLHPVT